MYRPPAPPERAPGPNVSIVYILYFTLEIHSNRQWEVVSSERACFWICNPSWDLIPLLSLVSFFAVVCIYVTRGAYVLLLYVLLYVETPSGRWGDNLMARGAIRRWPSQKTYSPICEKKFLTDSAWPMDGQLWFMQKDVYESPLVRKLLKSYSSF